MPARTKVDVTKKWWQTNQPKMLKGAKDLL